MRMGRRHHHRRRFHRQSDTVRQSAEWHCETGAIARKTNYCHRWNGNPRSTHHRSVERDRHRRNVRHCARAGGSCDSDRQHGTQCRDHVCRHRRHTARCFGYCSNCSYFTLRISMMNTVPSSTVTTAIGNKAVNRQWQAQSRRQAAVWRSSPRNSRRSLTMATGSTHASDQAPVRIRKQP